MGHLARAQEAASDQLRSLEEWNQAGKVPRRTGFVRPLPDPFRVTLEYAGAQPQLHQGGVLGLATSGNTAWAGSFRVEGARALRLRLTDISLPPGTVLWVYGDPQGDTHSFTLQSVDPEGGGLWSPTVEGETIWLEVQLPEAALTPASSFAVADILEIVDLPEQQPSLDSRPLADTCFVKGACVPEATQPLIADYREAIARLSFINGSYSYLCSGGLLNDNDLSGVVPYLLTANHCFSNQSSASSLEAYWDYTSTSCGGSLPSLYSVPRTLGSTLLATGTDSDFTFVRLAQAPPGPRYYLGWDANSAAVGDGTVLDRVSHPNGGEQHFTRSAIEANGLISCPELPRPRFIYSSLLSGGTAGGSSGSPAIKDGGYVVGQLFGVCGSNIEDNCDGAGNRLVDGAFASTYSQISNWLENSTPPTCVPNSGSLCLNNSRFRVEVQWRTPNGTTGAGQAVAQTGDTGSFWFFSSANLELFVKMLDSRTVNGHFWFFWGALTDVEYRISVTDTTTGAVKQYTGAQHVQASGHDLAAF
ncbi:MAG: hypothetical protein EHM61_25320 [Acidobacteria bacterium]|nr:MAG: hypothetical protein EHM61_25320 [Acidobacteriota bacterium]